MLRSKQALRTRGDGINWKAIAGSGEGRQVFARSLDAELGKVQRRVPV